MADSRTIKIRFGSGCGFFALMSCFSEPWGLALCNHLDVKAQSKNADHRDRRFNIWWWILTENQTHISAVSQPRSEALRPSRDSGEGFRATAHAHDCKFREADWHSQLPQLPGNLGAATWLSSRLSP